MMGAVLALAVPAQAQMRAATGSYVGNATGGRAIPVGFQPDVVIVKADSVLEAVATTSTMPADSTKFLSSGNAAAANLIQSLTATGFTVGTASQVNNAGIVYYWTALKAAAGELQVGTYTGNAPTDNRLIPTAFAPDWVLVMGAALGQRPVHRNSAMAGDVTVFLDNTGPQANGIQALLPGGFEVGTSAVVNASGGTYHYVAARNTPGRIGSGIYTGNGSDNRNITGVGFQPVYTVIKMTTGVQAAAARPDSLLGDSSLFFTASPSAANLIQALQPDGFQIGTGSQVNSPQPNMWVAFGGAVNYRSIGTAPDYTAGTVEGTPGSQVVTGSGTQWTTANRGRGDRILIDGTNYTVLSVDSQTQLRLTTAYVGTPGPGKAHTVSRQYATLQAWENCISFLTPTSCSYFQVPSASLVADLRSEVGIAYDDVVGADFAGGLVFDNAVTDAGHTITLTADGANRHNGLKGQGVVIDNGASVTPAVSVFDDFVTVEWMEITGGGGTADGIRVNLLSAGLGSLVVVRNNLIRNITGDGIALYDPDGRVDVFNNIVHNAVSGLWLNSGSLAAGSRFRVLNNTFFNTQGGMAKAAGASAAATLLLRNNISFGSTVAADYDPDPADSLDPASSHNLSEDATATAASPAGSAQTGVTLAQIAFFSTTPGSENLHIRFASVARGQGASLSAALADDIDGLPRPVGASWDKGADEAETQVQFRSIGMAADLTNQGLITVTAGSTLVSKVGGTGWLTANRGRGDRLTVGANHYMIRSVDSDNQLTLALPAVANYVSQPLYTIARQFQTFQQWEDCISRSAANTCKRPADVQEYFATSSSSLVADDRREVGIAYKDSVFTPTVQVLFEGATTDTTHTITLTADGANRHNGVAGAGVVIDGLGVNRGFRIEDSNYTVEWLEFENIYGVDDEASILIRGGTGSQTGVLLQNLLIHDFFDGTANVIKGIGVQGDGGKVVTIRNVMIWNGDQKGIEGDAVNDTLTIENCTVHGMANYGIDAFHSQFVIRNTIATGNPSGDFVRLQADGSLTGSNNTSSDATAAGPPAVFANAQTSVAASSLYVDFTGPVLDLHLQPTAAAVNTGQDLSPSFYFDIDGQLRPAGAAWDRGADEQGGTTEVSLESFTAIPENAAVRLEWRTGSELSNLGFHLYRSLAENGPWTRLTTSLIPGLGSSAVGQGYSFRDGGLQNGTRYFYRLEDVDASSKATSHGPVSAVPAAAAAGEDGAGSGSGGKKQGAVASSCPSWVLAAYGSAVGSEANARPLRCTRHGDPEAVSLEVLSRDSRQATLELRTGGFYALHIQSGAGESLGTVRVFVPGFDFPRDDKAAALPIRRALTDAVVGRRVRLGGVRALDLVSFKGLVPSALGKAEMQVGLDGTVRAARRETSRGPRLFPKSELVTLLPSLFQGETKSAAVEIAPLRFDPQRRQLVLAKRVRVRLLFTGREAEESGRGSHGRVQRSRKPVVSGEVLARLHTTSRGLHSVPFEQLFPGQRRGLASAELRLERQGEPVRFHLEPAASAFGLGSRLFFYAATTAGSTDFSAEVAYELVRSSGGAVMPVQPAAPGSGAIATPAVVLRAFETDRFYQPGLLDATDPWLWEALASGATRVKSLVLSSVSGTGTVELGVFLQGASESGQAVDHHVSVSVNGKLVGEAQFTGKAPYRMSLSLPASLLREGANDLSLTNVADTGVSSLVFLDRVSLAHPQTSSLTNGVFEGTWAESGTAAVAASGAIAVLDVTDAATGTGGAHWLSGFESSGGNLRFRAEAGRRYIAVAQSALLNPRIAAPEPSTLRATTNRADYILVAPRAFLTAAELLVERRQDQGLNVRAVAFEEIASEFGHGQASAEAIQRFLAYAFHSWARPSPRYVLLLGDASYDPRNFMGTSPPAPLPALWTKTSYLWTVSDPLLAAVNGDDTLPDLAIGRLPAATVEQAGALVAKLVAWEESGQGLRGTAALVADNPDLAGDFEADIDDIAQSYLQGRPVSALKLSALGGATRPAILDALNAGLSHLSYVGHGGAAVWASENVWNSWDAPSLQAQSQQPLLVTMNCLNGYFVAPAFESLSESLLKAEGRGAIASFSPSGLSLDGPAHQYHRALMAELTSGRHERLGDAVLAAQKSYAEIGLMPELLGIYHLLGDPAMIIR